MRVEEKLDKNKIYFIDSYGRRIGILKSAIRFMLKKRSAESVTDEILYVLKRTKRGRNFTNIRNIALELGINYSIVKSILSRLSISGEVRRCIECCAIPEEKYEIILKENCAWSDSEE